MYLSTHLFKQFFLTFHEHCEKNRSMYNNLYYLILDLESTAT